MIEEDKLIKSVNENNFFVDFIAYLQYIEKQPIGMTATGMISISKITPLLDSFKQRDRFDDFDKFGWKMRQEHDLEFLSQIKIIAEVMNVTYKRKGEIRLSKNGHGYLHNIDPLTQYINMVLFYWNRVNWEYFSPSREVNRETVIGTLQKNQKIIWTMFGQNTNEWIDFKIMADRLRDILNLKRFYTGEFDTDFSCYLNIRYGLFWKNLVLFGCVEVEEKEDENKIIDISRFRITTLGESMFSKGLNSWV